MSVKTNRSENIFLINYDGQICFPYFYLAWGGGRGLLRSDIKVFIILILIVWDDDNIWQNRELKKGNCRLCHYLDCTFNVVILGVVILIGMDGDINIVLLLFCWHIILICLLWSGRRIIVTLVWRQGYCCIDYWKWSIDQSLCRISCQAFAYELPYRLTTSVQSIVHILLVVHCYCDNYLLLFYI